MWFDKCNVQIGSIWLDLWEASSRRYSASVTCTGVIRGLRTTYWQREVWSLSGQHFDLFHPQPEESYQTVLSEKLARPMAISSLNSGNQIWVVTSVLSCSVATYATCVTCYWGNVPCCVLKEGADDKLITMVFCVVEKASTYLEDLLNFKQEWQLALYIIGH
jgi:hypothetical protein